MSVPRPLCWSPAGPPPLFLVSLCSLLSSPWLRLWLRHRPLTVTRSKFPAPAAVAVVAAAPPRPITRLALKSSTMSTSLSDVPAQIARQDVATGVLGPYLVGCVLNLLLGGVYLGLFSSARADLRQQPLKAKAVSWAVFALMVCCIVMAAEELVDTGGAPSPLFSCPPAPPH